MEATKDFLVQKIKVIEEALKDTQASSNTETKSSAGDKHETSRAMAHIENERLAGQLTVLQDQLEVLFKINPDIESNKVNFGSVVICEKSVFFISVGIGKIQSKNTSFFAIATNTPVGLNLFEKKVGEQIKVGNNIDLIQKIL